MWMIAFALFVSQAGEPSCRTADARVEDLISSTARRLNGHEYCQSRLYRTIDDVDGDRQADVLVVFGRRRVGRVDDAIGKEILRVVQPAAVAAAVVASEAAAHQRDEVLNAWTRELEAARYAARRAQKQYDATDPENRLVADELERRWNTALQRVREIEERIEQHTHGRSQPLVPTRDEFENLAADLETVWRNPHADVRLKKRLVRTLIHEIVVDTDPEAGEVILVIHWKGGVHTELRVPRRRRGQCATHTSKNVVDAVRVLARICPDDLLANVLNRNGLRTGRSNRWTRERV